MDQFSKNCVQMTAYVRRSLAAGDHFLDPGDQLGLQLGGQGATEHEEATEGDDLGVLLQQGLEDSTSASALQEDFLEGSQEIQDQFILKPKHSAKNQARNQQGKGEPLPFLQVASLGSRLYS